MKLTLTYIILGVLAAAACGYIQSQIPTTIPWLTQDDSGNFLTITVNTGNTQIAAHWLAVLTLLLGLGVSAIGILYLLKIIAYTTPVQKTLVITGLILGVMMIPVSFLVQAWGFPSSFTRVLPDGTIMHQFWMSTRRAFYAQILSGGVFLLSLAISGCMITAYLKNCRRNNSDRVKMNTLPSI